MIHTPLRDMVLVSVDTHTHTHAHTRTHTHTHAHTHAHTHSRAQCQLLSSPMWLRMSKQVGLRVLVRVWLLMSLRICVSVCVDSLAYLTRAALVLQSTPALRLLGTKLRAAIPCRGALAACLCSWYTLRAG